MRHLGAADGFDMYAVDDTARGVTCYVRYGSAALACAPWTKPDTSLLNGVARWFGGSKP